MRSESLICTQLTHRLESERNPQPEDIAKRQEKKRKRLEAEEDLGHMAQDQRPVTAKTIATKKVCGLARQGNAG